MADVGARFDTGAGQTYLDGRYMYVGRPIVIYKDAASGTWKRGGFGGSTITGRPFGTSTDITLLCISTDGTKPTWALANHDLAISVVLA